MADGLRFGRRGKLCCSEECNIIRIRLQGCYHRTVDDCRGRCRAINPNDDDKLSSSSTVRQSSATRDLRLRRRRKNDGGGGDDFLGDKSYGRNDRGTGEPAAIRNTVLATAPDFRSARENHILPSPVQPATTPTSRDICKYHLPSTLTLVLLLLFYFPTKYEFVYYV